MNLSVPTDTVSDVQTNIIDINNTYVAVSERLDTTHFVHEVLRNLTRTVDMIFVQEVLRNYTRTVGMTLVHEVLRNYRRTVGMTKDTFILIVLHAT